MFIIYQTYSTIFLKGFSMKHFWLISAILISMNVHAKTAFTGIDYSGIYDCTGQDHLEGPYTGTVTIDLVTAQSEGEYGAYLFKLEVPGYGVYPGHAAAHKKNMAIYFANTDQTGKDFGTGIATFSKNKSGKLSFEKFYYEPEFKGGNFGKEICVKR